MCRCGGEWQGEGFQGNALRGRVRLLDEVESVWFEFAEVLDGTAPRPLDPQGDDGSGVAEADFLS